MRKTLGVGDYPTGLRRALSSRRAASALKRGAKLPSVWRGEHPVLMGVADHFQFGPHRPHQALLAVLVGAQDQVTDFVRDRSAQQECRIGSRMPRRVLDTVDVNGCERSSARSWIDDREAKGPAPGGSGLPGFANDADHQIAGLWPAGLAVRTVVPVSGDPSVGDDRARLVDR